MISVYLLLDLLHVYFVDLPLFGVLKQRLRPGVFCFFIIVIGMKNEGRCCDKPW